MTARMGKKEREEFRKALQALTDNGRRERAAGIDHETDEYLRLNRATWEAEKKLSIPERLWVRGQVD